MVICLEDAFYWPYKTVHLNRPYSAFKINDQLVCVISSDLKLLGLKYLLLKLIMFEWKLLLYWFNV